MKLQLTEALQKRKELKENIASLTGRLTKNLRVEKAEKDEPKNLPLEDPEALLAKLRSQYEQLESLVSRIMKTNYLTKVGDKYLIELIIHRDILKKKIALFQLALTTAENPNRYGSKPTIPTKNPNDIRKEHDSLSKELRELDSLIQRTNWETELL